LRNTRVTIDAVSSIFCLSFHIFEKDVETVSLSHSPLLLTQHILAELTSPDGYAQAAHLVPKLLPSLFAGTNCKFVA
jgi:hypothetical protein